MVQVNNPEPEDRQDPTTIKEIVVELREINNRHKRLEKEIFGNGQEGLRIQVAKIRQILFFATGIATIILTMMITDLFDRFFGNQSNINREIKEAFDDLSLIEQSLQRLIESTK